MAFTRKHKRKVKKRKKYKRSRRYNKTNKRRRKTKRKRRRKKNTRKKRRRKRQRGGYSTYKCDSPSNIGEIYTGIKLNTNPFLPDPRNGNTNMRGNQKGGHTKLLQHSHSSGMGGSFMNSIGLGDVLLNYYKGTDAIANQPIRYNGGKPLMNADPMHQPGLDSPVASRTTANIPNFYNTASQTAAANTIS